MELNLTRALSINEIASKLFALPVKVQFCHHLTTSYAAHKNLDGLYSTISDLKDEIIEKIIGYTGSRYTELSIPKITGFSPAMIGMVIKEVKDFGKQLEEWAEKQGFCDIENLAQSYSGAGAQAAYLNTLS